MVYLHEALPENHNNTLPSRVDILRRRLAVSADPTDYAALTRSIFRDAMHSDTAQPVYIPAKNEQDDLPWSILSVARNGSDDAYPVVVDNGSNDDTVKRALDMGAVVIDAPHGKKMAATKLAFLHAEEEQQERLLFIDADTLVRPTWATFMSNRVENIDRGNGAALFGNSLLWHGESRYVDAVLSLAKIARGAKQAITGEVTARGHNYAVKLDRAGAIQRTVQELDDDIFAGDDWQIKRNIGLAGAAIAGTTNLKSLVVTRNDRVRSLRERVRSDYSDKRRSLYDADQA